MIRNKGLQVFDNMTVIRFPSCSESVKRPREESTSDLLGALLGNGSVNKPQQRDCFLCGPPRDRYCAAQR
jgi:hypothetical protein